MQITITYINSAPVAASFCFPLYDSSALPVSNEVRKDFVKARETARGFSGPMFA